MLTSFMEDPKGPFIKDVHTGRGEGWVAQKQIYYGRLRGFSAAESNFFDWCAFEKNTKSRGDSMLYIVFFRV